MEDVLATYHERRETAPVPLQRYALRSPGQTGAQTGAGEMITLSLPGWKPVLLLATTQNTNPLERSKRSTSALVDGLFFGSANLFFCLEPVVALRAGFVAALDVEFGGAALDSFFEGGARALDCRCDGLTRLCGFEKGVWRYT